MSLSDSSFAHQPSDFDEAGFSSYQVDPSNDEWSPTTADWEDYAAYLDLLDQNREYPPVSSPLWKAWLARTRLVN